MAYPIINKIIIHCSATQNGKSLATKTQTAAQVIDAWHAKRGFRRAERYLHFNPRFKHIGYQFVIDTDGTLESGRAVGEIGAHVKGYNQNSIGICLVGGISIDGKNCGRYTAQQWRALYQLLQNLAKQYPDAEICGHRDLSPDLNDDGTITPNEWIKDCPCFDVASWLDAGEVIYTDHLFKD